MEGPTDVREDVVHIGAGTIENTDVDSKALQEPESIVQKPLLPCKPPAVRIVRTAREEEEGRLHPSPPKVPNTRGTAFGRCLKSVPVSVEDGGSMSGSHEVQKPVVPSAALTLPKDEAWHDKEEDEGEK
mmetsp:Transcript_176057/g.559304  ORF Transcript_176057/g.559304 Transcript_176057/m.559304 type:complete len:129 (+) Transcript_176057:188-574(+)